MACASCVAKLCLKGGRAAPEHDPVGALGTTQMAGVHDSSPERNGAGPSLPSGDTDHIRRLLAVDNQLEVADRSGAQRPGRGAGTRSGTPRRPPGIRAQRRGHPTGPAHAQGKCAGGSAATGRRAVSGWRSGAVERGNGRPGVAAQDPATAALRRPWGAAWKRASAGPPQRYPGTE